ncbi:1-phosphatidylinositol 4,5-bisphosphate phosphodiesterase gamma-1 [Bagarius yarrelli]|uniref:1-phosphatidylinositol 4,5-bisphosphate phosphodiesterase gamma-1 n=1 Tax=Bagarius yarrelli TaxID=175774 RepID=A0A556V752_BAGYA|nr:1-phosphatidylinositol 4,5-bisphosphate phosphodiesterase gamma-1 [Bagarius yarrelli]
MQLNQALFMLNGKSGFVLQPTIMRDDNFDPFDRHTLRGVEPVTLIVEVLGARHLPKHGRGIVCPLIEIEVCGAEYDCTKQKTDSEADNGLNPTWPRKPFRFTVYNPTFTFLRFVVYEIDMERLGESVSSMSPLPSSPAQALGYRGREGSFESRYQSPLDDFRVSQEALLDHMDPQNRSRCVFGFSSTSHSSYPNQRLLTLYSYTAQKYYYNHTQEVRQTDAQRGRQTDGQIYGEWE